MTRRPVFRPPAPAAFVLLLAAAAGCGAKSDPPAEPAGPPPNPIPTVADADDGADRSTPPPVGDGEPGEVADDETDAALIARFAGTYTRDSYGHRVMTVRPDGTATMTVDVDPFYQWMVGPKVTVEIAWELTGEPTDAASEGTGRGVHFASVSGDPPASFEAITKLFGTEADWRIESADDTALTLYDPTDEETVVWARVDGGADVKD